MKRRHKENADQQRSLSDFGFQGQSTTKNSRSTDQLRSSSEAQAEKFDIFCAAKQKRS